ncbi:MAG TPA: rhodanese-like domain-containing protein [Patescibacteria group bacterium]|nr:rhodanese-like domain-containing protein [Patescibacteria group bacterium]
MRSLSKVLLLMLIASFIISAAGCSTTNAADEGQYIIEAKEAAGYIGKQGAVIVDMQKPEEYAKAHIKGAVNIALPEIVINTPVPNMLAPKAQIENLLGSKGIGNETMVIIYDNNKNMEAARLWWTLRIYGHDNAKVVSGGFNALQTVKLEMTTEAPAVTAVKYIAKDMEASMIATIDEVKAHVNQPEKNVILLDTRTKEEFDQGTIPGSILFDFNENNYKDGTYKKIVDTKIQYIEKNITPDKTVIMYCKTSVRAAQTYLALYNAGYRNMKVYDGAWLEWEASTKPQAAPAEAAAPIAPAVQQPQPAADTAQPAATTEVKPESKPGESKPKEPAKAPQAAPQPTAAPQPAAPPPPQPTPAPVESNNNDNS